MPFGEEYADTPNLRGTQVEKFQTLYGAASTQAWHLRMMLAAEFFGSWSKCLSRKIGAVIVRDKTILSTGYNVPPRGVPECHTQDRVEQIISANRNLKESGLAERLRLDAGTTCPRKILGFESGKGLEYCIAGHAEANAVANGAREGVRLSGATMYAYCGLPCQECSKMIIGAGLERVFYIAGQKDYDNNARWMLMNAGVSIVGITQELIEKYRASLQ